MKLRLVLVLLGVVGTACQGDAWDTCSGLELDGEYAGACNNGEGVMHCMPLVHDGKIVAVRGFCQD